MSRSEANSARVGYLLLAVAGLAIALWILEGGSSYVTVALVCLVGSLASFMVAWKSSWDADRGVGGPPRIFPIADYDELWVSEILPMLSELDRDELEDVFRHERSRGARPSILHEIDALLAGSRPARGRTRR